MPSASESGFSLNGCYDISLNITEKPFASVPFEVHFVVSPAPSLDERTLVFFVVVNRNRRFREIPWLAECCLLKLMQVSWRE